MAYGVNTLGKQPRSHFQKAGGCVMKYKHPYLSGQLSSGIDEIDVSGCTKLAEKFFEAVQNIDSAKQEILIDGTVVTITNSILSGTINIPLVPTSGLVAEGDFIEALKLIVSQGDRLGGIYSLKDFIDGRVKTTIFYGVTPKKVPHLIKHGTEVATYATELLYAGFIEAVSESDSNNEQAIWATGNATGVQGYFTGYDLNDGGSGEAPVSGDINGMDPNWADETGQADKGIAVTEINADNAPNVKEGFTILKPS